uniref:AN1-type zinc finger protein 6 n=1 Tax=Schistocephalus solidus TaxID=70667 RepID=A0A0X3PKA7_SCHSO
MHQSKMEENDQAQAVPRLCRKGCGFYGSPNFDGFCSKCHRDMQATAEQVQSAVRLSASSGKGLVEDKPETTDSQELLKASDEPNCLATGETSVESSPCKSPLAVTPATNPFVLVPKQPTAASSETNAALASPSDDPDKSRSVSPAASESAPKKRLRCLMCNKRVGLTGFSCRCGGLFCTLHRYSDAHDCSFNYRESGQADIRKANPQVVCSKITKI